MSSIKRELKFTTTNQNSSDSGFQAMQGMGSFDLIQPNQIHKTEFKQVSYQIEQQPVVMLGMQKNVKIVSETVERNGKVIKDEMRIEGSGEISGSMLKKVEEIKEEMKEKKKKMKEREIRFIGMNEKDLKEEEKKEEQEIELKKKYQNLFDYEEEGKKKEKTEEESKESWEKFWAFVYDTLLLIVAFTVDIIANCTLIYPSILLLSIAQMVMQLFQICSSEKKMEVVAELLLLILIFLGCCSTIFLQVMSYFYLSSDKIERFWFLDATIFFMSTLLVCSYIKSIQVEVNKFSDIFNWNFFIGPKVLSTLFVSRNLSDAGYVFDCVADEGDQEMIKEYDRIMEVNQIEKVAQKFNLFYIEHDPITLENQGQQIVMGCNRNLHVQMSQYLVLIFIIALKTAISLTYIFLKKQTFNMLTAVSIATTTLFYINMTWCLNKVISNYDLRRKCLMMSKVNQLIDFKQSEEDKGKKKVLIDVTDPISLEAWDNTRSFVLQYFSSKLQKLELVYVCLFFYYVFVTVICVVAYGEFYSIIPKESLYLQPLMVIQNSFDFIFLNTILMWRIYTGQQLNDTFDESSDNLDYLIGMAEDLIQMFDIFFLPERSSTSEQHEPNTYPNTFMQIDTEDMKSMEIVITQQDRDQIKTQKQQSNIQNVSNIKANSVYGKFILRVKYLSHYYINTRTFYLGTLYSTQTKRILQKEILKNMLNSYRKLKEQVQIDSKQYCYKFLNAFKLEFTDICTTLTLAFLSVLPNVIPKLIEIFENAS